MLNLVFTSKNTTYSFPCDENGNIVKDKYYNDWKHNLRKCNNRKFKKFFEEREEEKN